MTAVEVGAQVVPIQHSGKAGPGRPAKPLEWARGVGRRLDLARHRTARGRGLRASVVKAVAFALMIHADAEGKCTPAPARWPT